MCLYASASCVKPAYPFSDADARPLERNAQAGASSRPRGLCRRFCGDQQRGVAIDACHTCRTACGCIRGVLRPIGERHGTVRHGIASRHGVLGATAHGKFRGLNVIGGHGWNQWKRRKGGFLEPATGIRVRRGITRRGTKHWGANRKRGQRNLNVSGPGWIRQPTELPWGERRSNAIWDFGDLSEPT